jgi:hypothetical protein
VSSGGKQTARIAEITAEEARALDLRIAGNSIRQIAEAMQIPYTTAHRRVSEALAKSDDAMREKAAEHRELEAQRLERVTREVLPLALGEIDVTPGPGPDGEPPARVEIEEATARTQIRAALAIVKLSERKAKMLGLDKPTVVDVNVTPSEFDYSKLSPEELLEAKRLRDKARGG